jgi:hypothetical protein
MVERTIPLVRLKGAQGSWVVDAGPPYGKMPVLYITDFNVGAFRTTVDVYSVPGSSRQSHELGGSWLEAMAKANYVAVVIGGPRPGEYPRQYLGVSKVSRFVASLDKTGGKLTIQGLVALDERMVAA